MDGTGVPMRTQEVADRADKQADCSAKTREAKLVTIWTAESRDEEGELQCAAQDRSLIRPRLKAQKLWIPVPTSRPAYSARPAVVVSPKLSARWCWAMAQPGFGTRLRNYSRKPLRFTTGVVEAGCKVVIGTRLERAGMHRTVKGANTIIALRCSRLSVRFEDFWERRSDQRKTALLSLSSRRPVLIA
jgi:hypothetical protein